MTTPWRNSWKNMCAATARSAGSNFPRAASATASPIPPSSRRSIPSPGTTTTPSPCASPSPTRATWRASRWCSCTRRPRTATMSAKIWWKSPPSSWSASIRRNCLPPARAKSSPSRRSATCSLLTTTRMPRRISSAKATITSPSATTRTTPSTTSSAPRRRMQTASSM